MADDERVCPQCEAWLDEHPHAADCPEAAPDYDDEADIAYELWRDSQ